MTETSTPGSAVDVAERLATTLGAIGDALVALDLQRILASEATLADLVSAAQSRSLSDPADRVAMATAVVRARQALLRCRRLGASFGSIVRARLPFLTGQDTYTRDGAPVPSDLPSTVALTI